MPLAMDDRTLKDEDVAKQDAWAVDIDGFEGPLHLLLDLARRQKVDLLHVSILDLARQYLAFVRRAREKRIDLAADYLLMAAWLAWLKSRLLLPRSADDDAVGTCVADNAPELAFRLRKLNAMRKAGAELMNGTILGRDVFLRGQREQPANIEPPPHDNTSLWQLMTALNAVYTRKKQVTPHGVHPARVLSPEHARDSLRAVCRGLDEWVDFASIPERLDGFDRDIPPGSIVASLFAAMLELVREGSADMRQSVHFGPLYLRGCKRSEKGRCT